MCKYEYECESTSNKYVYKYKLGKVNEHQIEMRTGASSNGSAGQVNNAVSAKVQFRVTLTNCKSIQMLS